MTDEERKAHGVRVLDELLRELSGAQRTPDPVDMAGGWRLHFIDRARTPNSLVVAVALVAPTTKNPDGTPDDVGTAQSMARVIYDELPPMIAAHVAGRPASRDIAGMDRLAALLDRKTWDSETLDTVADIVRECGRDVREPIPCARCGANEDEHQPAPPTGTDCHGYVADAPAGAPAGDTATPRKCSRCGAELLFAMAVCPLGNGEPHNFPAT